MSVNVNRAGFWLRLSACAVDCAIVYATVRVLKVLAASVGAYLPLEGTLLAFLVAYSTVLTGWKGATLGKRVCGLTVCLTNGHPVGCGRAFFRESLAKLFSAVFFMVGYLWVPLSRSKRGWHDQLAQTVVVRTAPRPRYAKAGAATGFVLVFTWLLGVGWQPVRIYLGSRHLRPSPAARPAYLDRDATALSEISNLSTEDKSRMAAWLRDYGHDPDDFLVQTAGQHDATIIGEVHFVRENLDFLNRLIPRLYHESGVTCIAMECICASDNELAERIVTGRELRRDLIMELARRHGWRTWGWSEYWRVLEAVWRINRALGTDAKPMRVVGLMPDVDLTSFALSGISDGYRRGTRVAAWERLRLPGAALGILTAGLADSAYAMNVEREILEKGERGVVWVGAAHAPLMHRQPSYANGREYARMGYMLHEKYGNRLAHVLLHNVLSAGPAVAREIEHLTAAAGLSSVGFRLHDSPLGALRDSDAYPFSRQAGACLMDLADGYVLLKPTDQLQHCTWMEGYVSLQMFAEYKPFYEMLVDQKLSSSIQADRAISATLAVP